MGNYKIKLLRTLLGHYTSEESTNIEQQITRYMDVIGLTKFDEDWCYFLVIQWASRGYLERGEHYQLHSYFCISYNEIPHQKLDSYTIKDFAELLEYRSNQIYSKSLYYEAKVFSDAVRKTFKLIKDKLLG